MTRMVEHPKPDLARLSSRQMIIPPQRQTLEMALHEWVSEVVAVTRQPPENGFRPETLLMRSAQDSIDLLMNAPTSMAVGGKRTVHAIFHWGRFPDGRWYVSSVTFGLDLNAAQQAMARQRVLRARLLDQAELRNSTHLHLRETVFPAAAHVHTWGADIKRGNLILQAAIERAHEHAAKDAAMLENPVTPVDMALDLAGHAVGSVTASNPARNLDKMAGQLAGEERAMLDLLSKNPVAAEQLLAERTAHATEALVKAREYADKAKTANDIRNIAGSEKSRGDKALETALNVSSYIPGAGPFIKTIAGMMMDIAIASDAARVTRLRSRCYVYFVAGYVGKLTLADTGTAKRAIDRKYFELGINAAPPVSAPGNFCVQVALMDYAASHYTDGGWGGLGFRAQSWDIPDQYIVKWSPELLGRAFATQLHKRRYLIE
jgi:hypothetical protein